MTIDELADNMSQKIWLDVSEPMLPLKDRYRLMRDRIVSGLSSAHEQGFEKGKAEGALEENAKWEQWTGQSRHPYPMCKCSIPDPKEKAMTPEETAAQDKMVEAFTKSVDDIMIQAINFRPEKEKHKETATERQERILKDKRDYSFSRFMFGRMNRRKP